MPILPMSLAISNSPKPLSFSSLTAPNRLSFLPNPTPAAATKKITTLIRMGGGPRTFPGGVSKWQWKRMQAKKAKQLLKARLCRERQIYEMRKRAELKAAVFELERPWEIVEKAPNLFSVGVDEQVKVLADRFQRPGGFDMWTEKDGPQLFETVDELPSARFFPKGVVHSVRPYKISSSSDDSVQTNLDNSDHLITEDSHSNARKGKIYEGKIRNWGKGRSIESSKRGMNSGQIGLDDSVETNLDNSDHLITLDSHSNARKERRIRNRGKGRSIESSKREMNSGRIGLDGSQRVADSHVYNGNRQSRRGKDSRRIEGSHSEIYDMSLEQDGRYKFQSE